MKTQRIQNVLNQMEKRGIEQMLISDSASVYYLTGKWIFPMERMMVLYLNTKGARKLFVNALFPLTPEPGLEIFYFRDTDAPVELLAKHLEKSGMIGIDKNWPARFLLSLMQEANGAKFVNGSPLIDEVRMIKDAEEIEAMRRVSLINDQAVEKLQKRVTEGMTEKQMANALARIYEELGVTEGFSFDPIVAFGVHTSDPHFVPGNDLLAKQGDAITLDIGCIKDSYCSDMTRTVFLGEPTAKQREVYETVLQANRAGIAAVKPGVRFCDVDGAARSYIEQKGYGPNFLHRTGHSIGIECHEAGDVSATNENLLQPGMIFSIEPGIYLAGEFGVRIEDLVLVTENGCEVLNKSSKELTVY